MVPSCARQIFNVQNVQPVAIAGRRAFATISATYSGHSRWSKIKHDKGKVDEAKAKQRSSLSREIAVASKTYGSDPNNNARLAGLIAAARKIGLPKASIELAIAKGQGRTSNGAALESFTIEAMLPPAIAMIIECQAASKAQTLQELRIVLKNFSATITATGYFFDRKGKITFESSKDLDEDAIFEQAIEAGALDVEIAEHGVAVVYTEPTSLASVATALETALGLKVESSEFVWDAKADTKAEVDSPETEETLSRLISRVEEDPSVQAIFVNTA